MTMASALKMAIRRRGTHDIPLRQLGVLFLVHEAISFGDREVRTIGRDLDMRQQAVSRAADGLERLGFVRRVDDEVDGRLVLLEVTAEGKLFIKRFLEEVGR